MIGDGGTFSVSPTANGFHLSRRASTAVEFTNIDALSLSETSYQDTGLTPETTYTWRLYEDLPHHRYNLMGEVTHTTSAAPVTASPTPTPGPTQGGGASAPTSPRRRPDFRPAYPYMPLSDAVGEGHRYGFYGLRLRNDGNRYGRSRASRRALC